MKSPEGARYGSTLSTSSAPEASSELIMRSKLSFSITVCVSLDTRCEWW